MPSYLTSYTLGGGRKGIFLGLGEPRVLLRGMGALRERRKLLAAGVSVDLKVEGKAKIYQSHFVRSAISADKPVTFEWTPNLTGQVSPCTLFRLFTHWVGLEGLMKSLRMMAFPSGMP
ncbi:hypothetical protein Zmor_020301 [Zophobas morio]|uniref:Uncharacterized protein n=1 Tax=Zophobas morio TaxID=2755281 RepID=A0AA38M9J6_9CUCU|nr:hypothetical protein Zmor_020301 [Zophobas morio]